MTRDLHLENLTLRVHHKSLLQNITLTIPAGKVFCLMGPSGSGKSTLLRCLNRLSEPPAGTIFLGGKDITTLPVRTLRKIVGMVSQQPALFSGTVYENLAYGPKLHALPFDLSEASSLLKQVDLDPDQYLERTVQTLSGGEAQRVALARTLANRPEILLLDEPTAALDPTNTRLVETVLLKLHQTQGLTLVWVSHDPQQVLRVSEYVYLLVQGQLLDQGTPIHVFREDSLHAVKVFAEGRWLGEA